MLHANKVNLDKQKLMLKQEKNNKNSKQHNYAVIFAFPFTPKFFCSLLMNSQFPFFPASSLHPNTSPLDSSRSTSIACTVIKQQQRIKAGTSHSLEPNMSSSSRQLYCFHNYPIIDSISFQTVRHNLLSQNKQHVLEAKEEVPEYSFLS